MTDPLMGMGGRAEKLFRRLNPQHLVTACRGREQSKGGIPVSSCQISESPARFTVLFCVPGHPSALPFESTSHLLGPKT